MVVVIAALVGGCGQALVHFEAADQSGSADLGAAPDLAAPVDLSATLDLAADRGDAADLSAAQDLTVPADLTPFECTSAADCAGDGGTDGGVAFAACCDHRCVSLSADGNCGACGVSCGGSTPICSADGTGCAQCNGASDCANVGNCGPNGCTCQSHVCTLGALGAACSSGATCASGSCVDGVCCDTSAAACGGCSACNLPGSVGHCANVPAGNDPHGACTLDVAGCRLAACNGSGSCVAPDRTACDDGDACTQTDTCQGGACSGGNLVTCTATDQCHSAGSCDPATGMCSNPPVGNGTACNDGNACTQTDTCQAGTCLGGTPVTCTASDQCHSAGSCDPSTGTCSNPPVGDGTSCNDGNACTQTDTCQAGVCSGANPVTCTANDACHDAGSCDPASGVCSNPVNGDCAVVAPVIVGLPARLVVGQQVTLSVQTDRSALGMVYSWQLDASSTGGGTFSSGNGASVTFTAGSTNGTLVIDCTETSILSQSATGQASSAICGAGAPVVVITSVEQSLTNILQQLPGDPPQSASLTIDSSPATGQAPGTEVSGSRVPLPFYVTRPLTVTAQIDDGGDPLCPSVFGFTGATLSTPTGSNAGTTLVAPGGQTVANGDTLTFTFTPDVGSAALGSSADYALSLALSYAGGSSNVATSGFEVEGRCGANRPLPSFLPSTTAATLGQTVTFDAGSTSDADNVVVDLTSSSSSSGCGMNETLTYTWSLNPDPSGQTFASNGTTSTTQTLTPSAVGTYGVNLAVSDGTLIGTSAIVPITVGATVPGAPSNVSATLVDATDASVSFTAPASDGGAAITSYTVTSSPDGAQFTGAASPIAVTGLAPGVSYTFTVTATNAVGTGPASAPSNAITTPATAPGAPTNVTAAAGNASAGVSFSAPASDGGSAILSYVAISSPGGITGSAASSPVTVAGLTDGTSYTFTVKAVNAIGAGPASVPSAAVIPKGPPAPPTTVVAAGVGTFSDRASINFNPGANNGSPITSYTVTSQPGNQQATGPASPIIVAGLTTGTSYTFTVTASNSVGTSSPSAPSPPFVPSGPPGAPSITGVSAVAGGVSVSFVPPVSNGGLAITQYTATSSPGGVTATGSASPITVTGLTQGTTYTFTVTATNAKGTGPASDASAPIQPGATTSTTILLAFSAALSGWIDSVTGYLFDLSNGAETDPNDGSTKIPPQATVPPYLQINQDTPVVSFDNATQRYYTYRYSYIDPATQLEYDRAGNPIGALDPSLPLLLLTSDPALEAVNVLDPATDMTSHVGVLLDPVTQAPLGDGTPQPFVPLQTPPPWQL